MKKYLVFILAVLLIAGLATTAVAGVDKEGRAGKSNVQFINLYEKDPSDPLWPIVAGGARGRLKFNVSGETFDFVFNGHRLQPNIGYSLIYYADPWPGNNPGAHIASGTSNGGGNIHLAGSAELNTDIPNTSDANTTGGKMWLVLSADYNSGIAVTGPMTGWNPTAYLFEHNLVEYDDTGA